MRSITIALVLGMAAFLTSPSGAAPVNRSEVDPCTLFSKAELESTFRQRYGPPKRGSTLEGPSCIFPNATRDASATTGAISVRVVESVSRAQFDSLRSTALGTSAESVSGIGESAFFWYGGLHVLSNGRKLIIATDGESVPKIRAGLLALGRIGASRLGR
jgi:hypothetical protein